MKKAILIGLMSVATAFSFQAMAEETVGEKVETSVKGAGNSIKKGYRAAKDKTCEMVNGKMECAAKKIGHKVQNGADKVENKAEEVINKTN